MVFENFTETAVSVVSVLQAPLHLCRKENNLIALKMGSGPFIKQVNVTHRAVLSPLYLGLPKTDSMKSDEVYNPK